MHNISAVVVDDEYFNRELIRTLVPKMHAGFKIMGEASGSDEAFDLIQAVAPQVVFLDVKMPESSGFDLLKRFNSIHFDVIFITGFDEYTLKALDATAVDYILKPIDLEKLKHMLERVSQRLLQPAPRIKLPLCDRDNFFLLNSDDILYVKEERNLTVFKTASGKTYSLAEPVSAFESKLKPLKNFIKADRGLYINTSFIASYMAEPHLRIKMRDGFEAGVLKENEAAILELLKTFKL